MHHPSIHTPFNPQFLFVQGKGGVGKTTFAHALAHHVSRDGPTLLVSIEDPLREPFALDRLSDQVFHLNNDAVSAFEEYAGLKIGAPKLVQIFLQNRFMRYVAKAAPGIRELVLMGKIWNERKHYAHVVVDMPATGHGITMFQSLFNWGNLFGSSPLAKDAKAMIETFSGAENVAHIVVSLPEEMPLVESLELRDHLRRIFPSPDVRFVANRLFPKPSGARESFSDDRPFAETAREHAARKTKLEAENLAIWEGEPYLEIPFFPPTPENAFSEIVRQMRDRLAEAEAK